MKRLIKRLIEIEKWAGDLYNEASVFFQNDPQLSAFLEELAEDEGWHFHVMGSAAEFLRTHPEIAFSQVAFDEEGQNKISSFFKENLNLVREGRLTEKSLYSCIASTEFSEWNALFLYVVDTLKKESREFQYSAARMQGHLDHIVGFLEKRPEGDVFFDKIQKLPQVWQGRILIVDDSEPLRIMLENILSRYYEIQTARHGKEGLDKVLESHFDVILSDIDMPILDGIGFFRNAVSSDPALGSRFLFISGFFSQEYRDFLESNGIPHMDKPVSLVGVRQKVAEIIEHNRRFAEQIRSEKNNRQN